MSIDVAALQIKLEEPLIITTKRGKGGFYVSLDVIPSSTILGAISAQVVLENVKERKGNCAKLTSPDTLPDCDNCSQESCDYRSLWLERKVSVCDATPIKPNLTTNLLNPPPIPNLQSTYRILTIKETHQEWKYSDSLLLMAAQRLALMNKFSKKILVKSMTSHNRLAKRKPVNALLIDGELEDYEPKRNEDVHVSINSNLKTSKKGILYSISHIIPGTVFRSTVIGDSEILDRRFSNVKLELGAARSRGYGKAVMELTDRQTLEDYVQRRGTEITNGLKKSNELLSKFDPTFEESVGTVTGLSALSLSINGKEMPAKEVISRRIGIGKENILVIMCKRGGRLSWDMPYRGFQRTPILEPGYAIAFRHIKDPEELGSTLARTESYELIRSDRPSGSDWVYLNHPLHFPTNLVFEN